MYATKETPCVTMACAPQSLQWGRSLPSAAPYGSPERDVTYAGLGGKRSDRFSIAMPASSGFDFILVENGGRVVSTMRRPASIPESVLDVFGLSAPPEILRTVILAVVVEVEATSVGKWGWAREGQQDQPAKMVFPAIATLPEQVNQPAIRAATASEPQPSGPAARPQETVAVGEIAGESGDRAKFQPRDARIRSSHDVPCLNQGALRLRAVGSRERPDGPFHFN